MSLYNAIYGSNPFGAILLELIGVGGNDYPIPRLRDVHLAEDRRSIVVFTRTGGGNDECYCRGSFGRNSEEVEKLGPADHFDGCYRAMTQQLRSHPLYQRDEYDDFDQTYAYFYFEIPEVAQEAVNEIPAAGIRTESFGKSFQALIRRLQDGDTDDERIQRMLEVGERIIRGIRSGKKEIGV